MTSSGHALSGGSPHDREEPHLTVAGREPSGHGSIRVPRGPYVRVVKPLFDRVVGFCIFVALLPLTGAVALAVRISLGSPVIFRQPRVGRNDQRFDVYKFRTMGHDRRRQQQPVEQDRRQIHKSTDDPRHTRVGRFLRKWSLDELPQFWNVVRGDMSLVGPRPELVEIVARYEPWQHQRHAVKPGLTGLWQVSSRGTGMMHLHTEIDLEYIETMGFVTDLKILVRTVPATLARRGN
jgi:lipopolysaccharide/colanic/teichoic acid biosynthesis glycosyltransferase